MRAEVSGHAEVSGRAEGVGRTDEVERVEAWAGPWPVNERWWSTEPRRRAFLQVLLSDGPAALLAADAEGWWLEGIYD